MTHFATAAAGFLLGAVAMGAAAFALAPKLMIVEDESRFGYAETVEKLVAEAEAREWKVPARHELDVSVAKAGFEVRPATVIELCQPKFAGEILGDDDARRVSSLMPCRIAVYETADGVTISRMNTGLMSRMFGGLVTRVMTNATTDSEAIIDSVIGG